MEFSLEGEEVLSPMSIMKPWPIRLLHHVSVIRSCFCVDSFALYIHVTAFGIAGVSFEEMLG